MNKTKKITAFDDEQIGDSNSIVNQKAMLESYSAQHGFENTVHYTDDGWSGANFERPSWKQLITDIEAGKVGCVIAKDMSRIGRDYLQTGFYTEVLFRQRGVRFTAISNGVDSDDQSSGEFAPFINIMSEWYVRDCSRKQKAQYQIRGKSGKPTTNGAYAGCSSLNDVYYGGTKRQWEVISIDTNNATLKSAMIHYNADIPNTPDTKPEPTPTPGPTEKPTPTPPVTPTPDPTSTPKFTDVKSGAYYYDAVIWAVKKGITSGTGNNKFSPDASCTRGQIVTFLWRAAGSPDPVSSANPFSDVKPSDYFYKAVLWAVENNITSGIGGGRFGPGGACTRGQAVTFLWRAEKSPNASAGSSFSDVKSGSYYEKAVDWAVSKNVTSGTGNGKFSPDASCTRGQIVTFLYRANG